MQHTKFILCVVLTIRCFAWDPTQNQNTQGYELLSVSSLISTITIVIVLLFLIVNEVILTWFT